MMGVNVSGWSLSERILVAIVVSLTGLLFAAIAQNHGWPTFGLGPVEISLLFLFVFYFVATSRRRGGDD